MPNRKRRDIKQYAALPCRLTADGMREIMLCTSRGSGRWIIPKGWPIKGLKPREVAAREAYEEAGLIGRVEGKTPVGVFYAAKQLNTDVLLCEVRVFLLHVDTQLADWPEKSQRQTQWFSPREAAALVDEGGLAEIILSQHVYPPET